MQVDQILACVRELQATPPDNTVNGRIGRAVWLASRATELALKCFRATEAEANDTFISALAAALEAEVMDQRPA